MVVGDFGGGYKDILGVLGACGGGGSGVWG